MLLSERKNCVSEKRTNKQTQEGKAMKKKDLVFLANELNEVLELEDDDMIDADQDPKKLEKELKKCVAGNKPELEIFVEDEFSDEAWELLAELGNKVAILKCETGEDETGEDETGEDELELLGEEEVVEEEVVEEKPKKHAKVKKKVKKKVEEIEEEKPKKKPAEKKEKKKEKKEKAKKKEKTEPGSLTGSRKERLYLAWKDGVNDFDKLKKVVDGDIADSTLKKWMKRWPQDKSLPAIATKG